MHWAESQYGNKHREYCTLSYATRINLWRSIRPINVSNCCYPDSSVHSSLLPNLSVWLLNNCNTIILALTDESSLCFVGDEFHQHALVRCKILHKIKSQIHYQVHNFLRKNALNKLWLKYQIPDVGTISFIVLHSRFCEMIK